MSRQYRLMLELGTWWWMSLVLVGIHIYGCGGCWEQERIGLLQLKASINYPNGTSLSSWVDTQTTDCCDWERVFCNPTTGRVDELNLLYTRQRELGDWYLNASLLLPFEELHGLNLSGNSLVAWAETEGLENLSSRLSKLEILDLCANSLNNSILLSLSRFSSLKRLDLSLNKLKGTVYISEALNNLEVLDLSENAIDSFKGLHHLSHLEELYLDGTSLSKNFLQDIGMLTSLKVLSLKYCGINGTLPTNGWCDLKNLEELDLSHNEFNGILPSCMGNLTSLRLLDLSHNQLGGNIASSSLTGLSTSLEYLAFSYNHFHVPTSFKSFSNHSNLKVILSDANEVIVETEFQTWAPRFKLKVFSLSYSKLNFTPYILYHQFDLRIVDLSHNNLKENFPAWLLENNTHLDVLDLRKNFFTGPLQLPFHPNPTISSIDISQNNIQDHIPTNISLIFPNVVELNMSNNGLEGYIPASFGDLKYLQSLDLSSNNLSGRIPEHLATGCSTLSFLKLSDNNLHGQIVATFFNLITLKHLYLGGNEFSGMIPNSMSNISLLALGISDNQLSGKLPRWMGNMSDMWEIDMSKNHFDGPIPIEFCNLQRLKFLDLSENDLSGSIPSCFNLSRIFHVHLSRNSFMGRITQAFYNSSSLVTLDLSYNYLSGSIPDWIGSLSALSILLLKANLFRGRMPIELCNLSRLSIMDLSQNYLSGPIPPCLGNITFEAADEKTRAGLFSMEYTFSMKSILYLKNIKIAKMGFPCKYELYVRRDVDAEQKVEFTTKNRRDSYKGNILNFMSGIDLSYNQLTSEIPYQLGYLSEIRALNLSHNYLTGSIPTTFANLRNVESMDLSYNNLNGTIPSQLTELNSLAVFNVSHNNLSGIIPDRKAQFATFEESSYEGNLFLCGPPLHKDCSKNGAPSPMTNASNSERYDYGFIDMVVFRMSFAASFITALLGVFAVLYINPHWRRAWFRLVESCMASWYYFVLENFRKLCNYRNM